MARLRPSRKRGDISWRNSDPLTRPNASSPSRVADGKVLTLEVEREEDLTAANQEITLKAPDGSLETIMVSTLNRQELALSLEKEGCLKVQMKPIKRRLEKTLV